MNLEIITSNNVNISPFSFNIQKDVSHNIDPQVEKVIKKARAMISLQKKTDHHIMNLIQMAETALKNGNSAFAEDFAQKAIQMLLPENIPGGLSKEIQPPESGSVKNNQDVLKKTEQTEHIYQDVSNDPGVSFSYPGKLTGPESFLAVPAHEHEHIRHSLREAIFRGEKVLVFASYKIRYDPATGEPYMAGGLTRTIRIPGVPVPEKGKQIDVYA